MEYYRNVSMWREFCDTYMDPRRCEAGGGRTCAESQMPDVRDLAQKALDDYNLKEQKNFALERIVKLNTVVTYYSMTFWAVSNETCDRHLFRGVVDVLGGEAVLLCEIKEDEVVFIPPDHVKYCIEARAARAAIAADHEKHHMEEVARMIAEEEEEEEALAAAGSCGENELGEDMLHLLKSTGYLDICKQTG